MRFAAASFVHLVHCANETRNASQACELGQKFEPESLESVIKGFRELQDHLRVLSMPVSVAAVDKIVSNLERHDGQVAVVRYETRHLWDSMLSELEAVHFIIVPFNRSTFYESHQLFGSEVDLAFPSVSYDVAESGKCFALGRHTACVFHLMRVLEIGLGVFAKRFNVPYTHTNWHNVIEGIEKAVRSMASDPSRPSDWKDQQEFFAQSASHFMFLKDAWRNYTAHARGKYDDVEAKTIFLNTGAFMRKLATQLHE